MRIGALDRHHASALNSDENVTPIVVRAATVTGRVYTG